jgi:hypothetical protein
VADVSATEVKEIDAVPPVQLAVIESFVAPLLAKPTPVTTTVPDEPAPTAFAVAP